MSLYATGLLLLFTLIGFLDAATGFKFFQSLIEPRVQSSGVLPYFCVFVIAIALYLCLDGKHDSPWPAIFGAIGFFPGAWMLIEALLFRGPGGLNPEFFLDGWEPHLRASSAVVALVITLAGLAVVIRNIPGFINQTYLGLSFTVFSGGIILVVYHLIDPMVQYPFSYLVESPQLLNVSILLLGLAMFFADPTQPILKALSAEGELGSQFRRILALLFFFPPIVMAMLDFVTKEGLINVVTGLVSYIVAFSVVVLGVIVLSLQKIYESKETEVEQVQNLKQLNEKLLETSSQLEEQNQKLTRSNFELTVANERVIRTMEKNTLQSRKIEDLMKQVVELSKRESQEMVENIPLPIIMYKMEPPYPIIYANEAACSFSGFSVQEITNFTIQNASPTTWESGIKEIFEKRLNRPDTRNSAILPLRKKDGTLVEVLMVSWPYTYNNERVILVCGTELGSQQQVEQQYKNLSLNLNDLLFELDLNFRFRFVNSIFERFFEIKQETIKGLTVFETLPLPINGATLSAVRKVMETGEASVVEDQYTDANGIRFWMECTIFKSYSGITCVARNINERVELQQSLREKERRYITLFENSFQLTFALNEEGYCLQCNRRALSYLNLAKGELTESYTFWGLPGLSFDGVSKIKIQTFLAKSLLGETQGAFEVSATNKGGRLIYLRINLRPIFQDNGLLDFVLVECQDITEVEKAWLDLRQSEKNLREQSEFTNTIIELAPHQIFVYDLVEERIVFFNEKLAEFFGFPPEQKTVSMEEAFSRLHPDDIPIGQRLREEIDNDTSDETYRYVIRYKSFKNDEYRWFRLAVRVLGRDENGKPLQYLAMSSDIQELKEQEQVLVQAKAHAEEANLAKTNFLANMSHEIRNPINAMLGVAQLLEKNFTDDGKINFYLGLLQQSGKRLLTTIGEVLDLSRIESGITAIELSRVSINQLLLEVSKAYFPLLEEKGIRFEVNYLKIDVFCSLDQNLMAQVINNLLSNATKFTIAGQVKVWAEVEQAQELNKVHIFVADTGIGMSEEFVKTRLFKAFEQESRGFNRKFEGSGLGLHLCKKFVELQNGIISVQSIKGEGTTFKITLNEFQ